jgi:hypothetical protein
LRCDCIQKTTRAYLDAEVPTRRVSGVVYYLDQSVSQLRFGVGTDNINGPRVGNNNRALSPGEIRATYRAGAITGCQ